MKNLSDRRKSYEKFQLLENQLTKNPMDLFQTWFSEADENDQIQEANAMSISTTDEDSCPSTRIVLLKGFGEEGFLFYTNYASRKGKSFERYGKACLHFFWPPLEKQVMIKATIEKLDEKASTDYFLSRPIGSQQSAIVSPQSSVIPDRNFLEEKLKELEDEKKILQKPENWGGYRAIPYEIEFWQGRKNRLHDRIIYRKIENSDWIFERLAP